MKKLLFGMAFFTGAMMFSSVNLQAQEEEEPCPEGSTNQYGGVCCESEEDCDHPWGGLVAGSTWTRCVSGC